MEERIMGQAHEGSKPLGFPVIGWTSPGIPPYVPIEGRWCQLEPLNVKQHARDLFEANSCDSEGANWTYLPYGPFETLDDFCAWMEPLCSLEDPMFYAVIGKVKGGRLSPSNAPSAIGVASYLRIQPAHGVIEIGHLNFSPLLQGTPAATEVLYLMIKRVFDLGYRRCEWKCNALNAASRRAAQRFGFTYEGTFRQARIDKGRNRDTAWFSILDREWPSRRQAFEKWLDPSNFDAKGKQKLRLSELTG